MEPAPWLLVPFSDKRQTVRIINLISIAAGFFEGLCLREAHAAHAAGTEEAR